MKGKELSAENQDGQGLYTQCAKKRKKKKKNGRMTIHFIETPGSVGLKPTMTQPYDSIAQGTSSGSPSGKPETAADVRTCEQASHKPTSA